MKKLTAATVKRSNTLQQYLQAFAFPYFDWHSSDKLKNNTIYYKLFKLVEVQSISDKLLVEVTI